MIFATFSSWGSKRGPGSLEPVKEQTAQNILVFLVSNADTSSQFFSAFVLKFLGYFPDQHVKVKLFQLRGSFLLRRSVLLFKCLPCLQAGNPVNMFVYTLISVQAFILIHFLFVFNWFVLSHILRLGSVFLSSLTWMFVCCCVTPLAGGGARHVRHVSSPRG